ncbi:MAG: pantoate--beta-alanine ligase [Actinomycetia bacterium]|nr:pantoate--beta-alanine ligase [Actinomycetes bacterium]
MKQISTIAELRNELDSTRSAGQSVGFVPTMGYLHEGHGSLVRVAAAATDLVVVSVFVNPLQFAPDEDLDTYPRDLDRDRELASTAGAAILFTPTVAEMYPDGPVLTTVSVDELAGRLEGASRPTHFAGVATVVAKLFAIVGPCSAYFGEKDYQQLQIVTRMARDLSFPVVVNGVPTSREEDGLARSSRNVRLSPEERVSAVCLSQALDAGAAAIEKGTDDPATVVAIMEALVSADSRARLDYMAVVDPGTLEVPEIIDRPVRLLGALHYRAARLIDNRGAEPPD